MFALTGKVLRLKKFASEIFRVKMDIALRDHMLLAHSLALTRKVINGLGEGRVVSLR